MSSPLAPRSRRSRSAITSQLRRILSAGIVTLAAPEIPIAAAQEPFGNAVHTALATDLTARRVLITGCGPIGLFAIGIAAASGAECIFATDINPRRLALARTMGASDPLDAREDPVAAILRATDGEGVDVLLEMSGSAPAIEQG